jgi:formylglycine-generating enzyme required for sulfatase activity
MKLRLIPPGKFLMGASESESSAGPNEKPQHEVALTKPYCVAAHEVTVGQFKAFVKELTYKTDAEKKGGGAYRLTNSSPPMMTLDANTNWQNTGFTQTDDHPVVCATWQGVRLLLG